ncbi:gp53-like domain-containing protein [Serratia nevei]|uniref:gp53-like domain-containing protein n=1 Tax=Serratia nevei TaxID=2703794 RepID=UPI00301A4B4B
MKEIISPVDTEDGLFHDGDPSTGTEGTVVSQTWLNPVQGAVISSQQEMASVLKEAGIKIDPSKQDQLLAAIKKITGTATEGFLKVGDYGFGGGPKHKADAYNNIGEFYRVNGSSKNSPTTGVAGVVSLPCDGGPSTAYVSVSNAGNAWVGYSSTTASGVKWNRVYTDAYKPTAADINAYTKHEADGRFAFKSITVNGKPLSSNVNLTAGDVNAWNKTEADGRYVYKTNTINGKPLSSNITLTSSDIGLGNVGNFIAVQQGGGFNQTNSKVYIGWGNDGILRCTVDTTDLGQIYTTKSPPAFPVTSVNGKTGVVALNDAFSTDGTSLYWDSFSSQLRIQIGTWSIGAGTGASTTVAFPKAFPNLCLVAIPIPNGASAKEQIGAGNLTATTATFSKGIGDEYARSGKYLAVGY